MKRFAGALLVVAALVVMAGVVEARSAWDDDYPKNRIVTTPNGDTQVVRQKYPDQQTVVGNDGTVYQIVPGGMIDTRTGQFIPR